MFKTLVLLLTAYFSGMLQERKRQRMKEAEVPVYQIQLLAELFYWMAQHDTDDEVVSKKKIMYCALM